MTNEEKQALIDWLEEGLMCRAEYGFSGNSIKSMQIALAALTAPPVKLPDIEENEPAFNAGLNALIDCLEDCGDAEQGLRLALRAILRNIEEAK